MKFISDNAYDDNRIGFLFGVLCNGEEQMRYDAIIQFCACNKSLDSFVSLSLLPTHMSWYGSEVPVIERWIAFLNRIKTALKGIDFIEHRAILSQRIDSLEKRKNSVLLEEFLENR